jgi:polyphosphate kinase
MSFLRALRHEDILLHHPYDSFSSVTDFVSRAAEDPHTLAIKQTPVSHLGRFSHRAGAGARGGKRQAGHGLVELKARFDEENNIAGRVAWKKPACTFCMALSA